MSSRTVREELATISLSTRVMLAPLGRIDETWLYRADATPAQGIDGVVGTTILEGDLSLVRTAARDAVDRERLMRALHARLHERPMFELPRDAPRAARKLLPSDWRLVLALRRHPWGALDALAAEAKLAPRAAKASLGKLAAERIVALGAAPAEGLAHLTIRLSPSSTAAAGRALSVIDDVVHAWLPPAGEAAVCDALALGAPALDAARDVPGVAAVELRRVRASWEDAAAIDALVKRAATPAGATGAR